MSNIPLSDDDFICLSCWHVGPVNCVDLPPEKCTPDSNCEAHCTECHSDNVEPYNEWYDRMLAKYGTNERDEAMRHRFLANGWEP